MKMRWSLITLIIIFSAQIAMADWLSEPSVFMPTYYADQNPDVEKIDGYDHAKLLAHWKEFGLKEGRRSSPVFDVKYYLNKNQDISKKFGKMNYKEAAQHWYNTGRKEGRPSHPDFNVRIYLKKNPDVAKTVGANNYIGAIHHYVSNGYKEGRTAK
ncbi:MAG: hypothetical protein U9Q05_07830 [Thermodesulfobacteriota bacterium]|nr:hypothetical protein [Thermodesulfobacteriota bacterium]